MTDTNHLYCALCLHVHRGRARAAETVVDGNASCYEHMGYLAGASLSVAIHTWRRAHPDVEDQ